MHRAVERDSENRSNYAMCPVNPSRISKTFNDAALREVVDSIAGSLLEIVNYNVEVILYSFIHVYSSAYSRFYRGSNMFVLAN